MNECLQSHRGAPKGKEGKELEAERSRRRNERDGNAQGPALRAIVQPNLNEDVLTSFVEEAAAYHQREWDSPKNVVRNVAERIPVPLSARLAERVTAIDKSFLTTERGRNDVATFMEDAIVAIANAITVDDEVSAMVITLMLQRMSSSPSKQTVVENMSDRFIRSVDALEQRQLFAQLCHALNKRTMAAEVKLALLRALKDSKFIATRKGHYYGKTRTADDSSESDDDSEDSDGESGDKRTGVKVYMSGADELKRLAGWTESNHRIQQAERDWVAMEKQMPLAENFSKCRVQPTSLHGALEFISDNSLGWTGGKTQRVTVRGEDLGCQPYLNMALNVDQCWQAYQEAGRKNNGVVNGSKVVGRDVFRDLFKSITTKITAKHALSYYFTDTLERLAWIGSIKDRLRVIYELLNLKSTSLAFREELVALDYDFDDLDALHKSITTHVKYGIRQCIVTSEENCDGNSLHCGRYAVGAACAKTHTLKETCKTCLNFVGYARMIHRFANAVSNCLARELESRASAVTATDADKAAEAAARNPGGFVHEMKSMMPTIVACNETFNLYHKHVVRGVWQSKAYRKLLDELPVGTLVTIIDHKQKIEPQSFNESSEKYFGKKGISLLGLVVIWREVTGGPLRHHYIDTVVSKNKQDAFQVQTVLESVLARVSELVPEASKVVIVSDNGAALSNKQNLQYAWSRNRNKWGTPLTVVRWLFFESQCGKTILDTHFSFVGIMIRNFARCVRAVSNHKDVFDACTYQGIDGTTTVLLDFDREDINGADDDEKNTVTITGIRKTHDVVFHADSIDLHDHSEAPVTSTVKFSTKDVLPIRPFTILDHSKKESSRPRISATTNAPLASATVVPAAPKPSTAPPLVQLIRSEIESFTKTARSTSAAEETLYVDPASFTVGTDPKKAKTTASDDIKDSEFRVQYERKWSAASSRTTLPLAPDLEKRLVEMVSPHK
jgi:hypothetical protein